MDTIKATITIHYYKILVSFFYFLYNSIMNLEELQKQILEQSDKIKELESKNKDLSDTLNTAQKDLNNARDLNAKLMNRLDTREESKKKTRRIYTEQELEKMED